VSIIRNFRRFFAVALLVVAPSALASGEDLQVPTEGIPVRTDWTGVYVGANLGYGWGDAAKGKTSLASDTNCISIRTLLECVIVFGIAPADNAYRSVHYRGVAGGPQIGFNFQSRAFVFGGIADFQGTSIRGSSSDTTPAAAFTQTFYSSDQLRLVDQVRSVNPGVDVQQGLTAEVIGLATIRARAGLATEDYLFYGTGGLALGRVRSTISFARPALAFLDPLSINGSRDSVKVGWAAGGGMEYVLSSEWSVGVEYLHFDLGQQNVKAVTSSGQGVTPGLAVSVAQSFSGNIIRAALNYHF
jgi:outer membrane immunogenic protein